MRLLTIESVLVATELDATSDPALRTAARLAPLAGAALHLLHATDAARPDDVARLRERLALAVPDAPEPHSSRVVLGSAVDGILERAAQVEADVVVLGPHRRGPGDRGGLGSTAASVVRAAPCPCLVAATELRLPLERVLVAVDPSEVDAEALSIAVSWASALRPRGGEARILLLHVAPPGPDDAAEALRALAARAREDAGTAARVHIEERVVSGEDPVPRILDQAAERTADLLVLGTRRSDGASPLGSVSAGVVRDANCPVLLVPPAATRRSPERR